MQKPSLLIPGVQSALINNGLPTTCNNNILIFPTWEKYYATIEQLDLLTENYCNTFDSSLPANITDAQYDAAALTANFDEDNILIKFETEMEFCSLRKKLLVEENAWLDLQVDGQWNANTDPDNDFVDDDTERALLSYGHEVIIGTSPKNYKIYKLIKDNGTWIEIANMDLVALQQINAGQTITNNPNVVYVTPPASTLTLTCANYKKETDYAELNGNKIKRSSKLRTAFGTNIASSPATSISASRVIARTKGYVKRNNKWRVRRSTITAEIGGLTLGTQGANYFDCIDLKTLLVTKTKRRRKVKVKFVSTNAITQVGTPRYFNITVQDNLLYSSHKQGNLLVTRDYFDMPNN
ncbi:hypothetical protein [Flavobacterium sp.]|uniref:hypothetical protein n=1 Tax=Flavobacterium sp. TaxID=239 RepID=UPI00375129A2